MKLREAQSILQKEFFSERFFDKEKVTHFDYNFYRSIPSGFSCLRAHFYYLEEGIYFTRMYDKKLQPVGDSEEILIHLIEEKEKLENENPIKEDKLSKINYLIETFRLEILFLSKKRNGDV
jgi:hypothetical protein